MGTEGEKASSMGSGHWSSSEYSVIITWVSHTNSIIMIKHFIALNIILVSYNVMAMPMGEGEISNSTSICEQPREDSFSLCHLYNWFTGLSKLIRTTGDALEGVGQEYYPPLKGSGDKVSLLMIRNQQGWLKFTVRRMEGG